MNKIYILIILGFVSCVIIGSYLDYKIIGNHTYNTYLITCIWEYLILLIGVYLGYKLRGVHVSQEAVKRYIQEQEHKPNVFEYNVFGSPQQKIGDFT